jgi:hypothetical protein
MASASNSPSARQSLFIISGGAGALGKHLARIALSQFSASDAEVIIISQVRQLEQLDEAIERAAARGSVIIHTMVDPIMRKALIDVARQRNIPAVDTIGDLIGELAEVFQREPLGQPGIYHGDEEAYQERIRAIEYTGTMMTGAARTSCTRPTWCSRACRGWARRR